MTTERRVLACKHAALTRSRDHDDPELTAVRVALAEHRLQAAIAADAAAIPRATRERLSVQLVTAGAEL